MAMEEWQDACFAVTGCPSMSPFTPLCLFAAAAAIAPTSDEILTRIENTIAKRHSLSYSGVRRYKIRNLRFAKEATVVVQEIYLSGGIKRFTIMERSGSTQLVGIVEKMLASEAEESRPDRRAGVGINSNNYDVRLRGTGIIGGRVCYVLDLTAKRKNKYLINGTLWVDAADFGTVRLAGSTAASVSMWVGTPQIVEDFIEVGGHWLPSRTWSTSSGLLLGTSELEIQYTDYRILDSHTLAAGTAG
jgi:hypothetical protein